MIGLDTNVLVRYFTQDDPAQTPQANALLRSFTEDEPGYVSQVALAELTWVLVRQYGRCRKDIRAIVSELLEAETIIVEAPAVVRQALDLFESNAIDFGDCMIVRACRHGGCDCTLTFDKLAARAPGFKLLH